MRHRWIAGNPRAALVVPLLVWMGAVVWPHQAVARSKNARHGASERATREDRMVCDAAFEKAKEIAQSPVHFKAAAEWFGECAQPTCPRAMRRTCATVKARIIAKLPSVVPVVTGPSGASVTDVQVRIDGAPLTSKLDGAAIPVDPGQHQFTFARDGEIFATQTLTLEKGQQHQIVSASLQPRAAEREEPVAAPEPVASAPALRKTTSGLAVAAADADAAEGESPEKEGTSSLLLREREPAREAAVSTGAPWTAYALAGVGLAGLGGAALFNLKGTADNDALIAFCKPDCKPESVRHVRNLYLAADISLGIGLVALAGSTYLFFNHDAPAPEDNPRAVRSHISDVTVAPTPTGAVATVGGTF